MTQEVVGRVREGSSPRSRAPGAWRSSLLELRVAPEDVGRVIGKHGAMIDAIRWVLSAVASRGQRRVVLEIVAPVAGSSR